MTVTKKEQELLNELNKLGNYGVDTDIYRADEMPAIQALLAENLADIVAADAQRQAHCIITVDGVIFIQNGFARL